MLQSAITTYLKHTIIIIIIIIIIYYWIVHGAQTKHR